MVTEDISIREIMKEAFRTVFDEGMKKYNAMKRDDDMCWICGKRKATQCNYTVSIVGAVCKFVPNYEECIN